VDLDARALAVVDHPVDEELQDAFTLSREQLRPDLVEAGERGAEVVLVDDARLLSRDANPYAVRGRTVLRTLLVL
jgi:hypothetical protein